MESKTVVATLAALAQDTRLAIYRLLVEASATGLSVGEIGAPLSIAPATLSFHLKELAHAGLVTARQEGRYVFYSANYAHMNAVMAFLNTNCCVADRGPAASCCPPKRAALPKRKETR